MPPRRPSNPTTTPINNGKRPTWRCDVCHEPVTDAGSIYFSYSEWHRYRETEAAWKAAHTDENGWIVSNLAELGDHPELHWHVVHDACDNAAQTRYDLYWIDVARIDTWEKVVGWTAHLHGKRWQADTDWGSLLYRAGAR